MNRLIKAHILSKVGGWKWGSLDFYGQLTLRGINLAKPGKANETCNIIRNQHPGSDIIADARAVNGPGGSLTSFTIKAWDWHVRSKI